MIRHRYWHCCPESLLKGVMTSLCTAARAFTSHPDVLGFGTNRQQVRSAVKRERTDDHEGSLAIVLCDDDQASGESDRHDKAKQRLHERHAYGSEPLPPRSRRHFWTPFRPSSFKAGYRLRWKCMRH